MKKYHFTYMLAAASIIALNLLLIVFLPQLDKLWDIPSSILNMNTIFISILIEALPFVLIGVLIAGMIQIFVTEEHIQKNGYRKISIWLSL